MAAAMHCGSRRNILTPQPFLWSSWCHPLLCHFHFAFGSCHCTNKSSFSGNLCSAVWAHRMGPWGHCARLWVLLWGCARHCWLIHPGASCATDLSEPLSLAMGHCTNASTGWWSFLLIHMWSFLPSKPLSFVVGRHGQMQCSYCVHVELQLLFTWIWLWQCLHSSAMESAWRTVESSCSSGQVPLFPL